jgi:hypothetical protein
MFAPPISKGGASVASTSPSGELRAGGDGGTTLFRPVSSDEDGGNPANSAACGSERLDTVMADSCSRTSLRRSFHHVCDKEASPWTRDICSPNSHDPYYPVRTAIRFIRSLSHSPSVPGSARSSSISSPTEARRRAPWSVAAMWLILVGVLGAAAAAIFGTLDLLNLPRRTAAFRTGQIHAALNSAALVIFLINFIWRSNTRDSWEATPIGPLVLSIDRDHRDWRIRLPERKARLPLRRSA